ncbi:hypothetical protein ISTM_377 [Insectomime virus]|uniref:Uncharacterized protein n=1 Tax=Tunisvirus fontaine2 TaxID=1421067 RepID=V9SEJ3_9VIRU|nr:hypothetical protein D1R32_gp423 [Tunisvirus fontaine2]AHA46275.1 hypothetical protein ISTM_377 [Insectomime virus]AHC55140.1 hypothetical protein TNS_ORF422 [Tunisvirus fontaine2]
MSRKLCVGAKTQLVSSSGDYVDVGDLLPGDSLLSCDSTSNKILSISVSRKDTVKLGKFRLPLNQKVLVHSEGFDSFQDIRIMELGLFEPKKVLVKNLEEKHHLFRTVALFPFSELDEEPFVLGKRCALSDCLFPEKAKKNDKRTRALVLSGSLMTQQRPPDFDFVCCSLGLDPTKTKGELLDDMATCNSCSLVREWPTDPKKSKVFCLELERDTPIFLEDFVNI